MKRDCEWRPPRVRRSACARSLACAIVVAATSVAAPQPCAAQRAQAGARLDERAPRPPAFSLSLLDCVLLGSDYHVSVADASLSAGMGAGLGVSLELLAIEGVELGGQVMMLRRDSDDARLSRSVLTHLGMHAGPSFVLSDDVVLAVIGLLAYHVVSFADAEALTDGLGLGAAANLWLRITGFIWLRAQAGALMQPSGGHRATDVTFPPTPLLALGFAAAGP